MVPDSLKDFFSNLVRQGGPEPDQYGEYNSWAERVFEAIAAGIMTADELDRLLDSAGDATSSPSTMQGFVRTKPHGYAGDFEIIDRIYMNWHSSEQALMKWDRFFHAQAAPRAVCNRKAYFLRWLKEAESWAKEGEKLYLLNVGSGPARDVREFFESAPGCRIECVCVDHDPKAIAYARKLCGAYGRNVQFIQANALRFESPSPPQLIWSAGLFDYLSDELFIVLLRRLQRMLTPNGEIVIGNFSTHNPTRAYMRLGGWILNERNAGHLVALAERANCQKGSVSVYSEPEGVNLFLHVKNRRQ